MFRRRQVKLTQSLCIGVVATEDTSLQPILTSLLEQSQDYRIRVFTFTQGLLSPADALLLDRFNGISFRVEDGQDMMKRVWEVMAEHHAHFYFWIPADVIPDPDYLSVAIATWESIQDPHKMALTLLGDRPRPKNQGGAAENFYKVKGHGPFLACPEAIHKLTKDILGDQGLYRTQRSLLSYPKPEKVEPLPRVPPPPEPDIPPAPKEDAPPPPKVDPVQAPFEEPALEPKRAVFFMATHHRPHLLAAALRHLIFQKVPPGWTYDIWVVGEPHDPGKDVVAHLPQVVYHSIDSSVVTDKLNFLLKKTKAELVLLADDDDLQPLNRLEVAIKAHEEGAEWAGPGTLFMYATREKVLMKWIGRAEEGLVGTGMSYRTSLLRMINGWPRKSRGKDHPIAARITGCLIRVKFKSLDGVLGPLVGLQHGKNMWGRPVLKQGQKSKKGRFQILGMGTLDQVPIVPGFTRQTIALLGGENPIENLRLTPPAELPVTQAPVKSRARDNSRANSVKGNRIHLSITTCERAEDLCLLLRDIVREGRDLDVSLVVYDDASAVDYQAARKIIAKEGWTFIRESHRHGRRDYVALMSRVLSESLQVSADYHYFIQDDIRLSQRFFDRTTAIWDGIKDPNKATLFLLRDDTRGVHGVAPWTGVRVSRVGEVDRTQWVDGNAFMFGTNVGKILRKGSIPEPPKSWFRDPLHGSGFGRQVSRGLHKKGYNLYQTRRSYVAHVHRSSIMNPLTRADCPLTAVDFVDGETKHQSFKDSNPKVGLVGYCVPTGLGYENRRMWKKLPLTKWLVWPHDSKKFTDRHLLPPDEGIIFHDGSAQSVQRFLEGLDVVMCAERPFPSDLFVQAKRRGIRTVLLVNPEWFTPEGYRVDHCDLLVARNKFCEKFLHDRMSAFPRKPRIVYIPCPLDLAEFPYAPRKVARRFFFSNGWGGKLGRKGWVQIREALQTNPKLLTVQSQKAIKDAPAGVTVLGPVADSSKLYDGYDVGVQPSHWEGVGLAILEAMASGMPVITTDAAPMNEYVKAAFGTNSHLFLLPVRERVRVRLNQMWTATRSSGADILEKVQGIEGSKLTTFSKQARQYIENYHGEGCWGMLWKTITEREI